MFKVKGPEWPACRTLASQELLLPFTAMILSSLPTINSSGLKLENKPVSSSQHHDVTIPLNISAAPDIDQNPKRLGTGCSDHPPPKTPLLFSYSNSPRPSIEGGHEGDEPEVCGGRQRGERDRPASRVVSSHSHAGVDRMIFEGT